MNAEGLLSHYERIIDAPDAIARLRSFILDLAVRGKLVPQEAGDEPAAELLQRITKEKSHLPKPRGARNKDFLPDANETGGYFALPASWSWVRFARVADFSAGRTPSRNDTSFWNNGDFAWVSIADMVDGQVLTATKETVTSKARNLVFGSEPESPGTIIMSFKLTIGKIGRLGISAYHNEAIISIWPRLADFDPFIFRFLPRFARQGDTKGAIKGATLNRNSISNILLPLPPLAEQHRIVAKVDELMALCDRLEAAHSERETTRDRLAAWSFARLSAPDPETFRDDARFVLDALPALTTRHDQLKQIRQTILNLAVRGKLVPQDPTEEPASELLQRIATEKTRQVNAGILRKPRDLGQGAAAEQSFPIPKTWRWTRLDSIGAIIGGGTPASTEADNFVNPGEGVPWLTPADLGGFLNLYVSRGARDLSEKGLRTSSATVMPKGTVLFTSRAPIGYVAIAANPISTNQGFKSIVPYVADCSRFIAVAMKAFAREIDAKAPGTTFKEVSGKIVSAVPFPLPPLDEQHRIVAKVDELMALCDRLESSLTGLSAVRRRLLDALLAESLEPVTSLQPAALG